MSSSEKEHRKEVLKNMSEWLGCKVKDNGTSICISYRDKKSNDDDNFYSILRLLGFDEEGEKQ
ncbi:hypothetical protein [Faecalitalea cylindroides]